MCGSFEMCVKMASNIASVEHTCHSPATPLAVTPRTDSTRDMTPPGTPRTPCTGFLPRSFTPPPLLQRSSAPVPLWKALHINSVDEVRAVLDETPSAADELFWDEAFEPPLCCAVRLRCDSTIIQLLLESKASPHVTDLHGRTPLQLVQEADVRVSAKKPLAFGDSWDSQDFAPRQVEGRACEKQSPTRRHSSLNTDDFTFVGYPLPLPPLSFAQSSLLMATWHEATAAMPSNPSNRHKIWCQEVALLLGSIAAN